MSREASAYGGVRMVADAMSMQPVNLIPIEYRLKRRQAIVVRKTVFAAGCVTAVIALLLSAQRIQLSRLRFERERVRRTVSTHETMLATIETEKEKKKALEARAAIILNALDAPQWGRLLFEISGVMPEGVWLESLAFSPQPAVVAGGEGAETLRDYGEIRFQGGSLDAQSISRFMEMLAASNRFRDVTPVVAETPGPGRPARFTIVGRVLY